MGESALYSREAYLSVKIASDFATFFSENGHPFVCFADISPNRGVTIQERLTDEATKFTCKIDFKEAATLLASPERRGVTE